MISIHMDKQIGDTFFMKMSDGEEVLCEGSIIIGQACEILTISKDDNMFGYSMGKALLNLADLRNVKEVGCQNEKLFNLLESLGFKKAKDGMILLLDGYFSTKCEK